MTVATLLYFPHLRTIQARSCNISTVFAPTMAICVQQFIKSKQQMPPWKTFRSYMPSAARLSLEIAGTGATRLTA